MNREDLRAYRHANQWIREQLEKYEQQRAIAIKISQNIDGMPKAQNKPNYALENLIDQYNYITDILIADQKKQNEILNQVRLVKEPYRTILTDKYINGKSLEEVSVNIGYSYDRTCKMHGLALNLFDELDNFKSGQ